MAEDAARPVENRPRLGRGLAALLGDTADEGAAVARARATRRAPIEFLRANPNNPRRAFDEAELEDLAGSIRERGVLQPILVRTVRGAADAYEIVAGERRWRASQKAGLHDVPILVIEANDREAAEIALIENVQRADLNPIEEARGYERLAADHGRTQADVARIIGKSRSHIANTLRLLNLPPSVLDMVADGSLSAGHARALLAVPDPEAVAKRIVAQGLTVRDVERMGQIETKSVAPAKPGKDADTAALERSLGEILGLKVAIDHADGKGELRIKFKTFEQLDSVVDRIRG
ncbi:MAG: ParB/RepB/Spo0J family partition protein [Hyphomicrobiales bacterium]|nr:ParB/RepB/Spo0J family partition protein [Hyphomicrobiales bacterium]MDE2016145.1 ParB/RepB/Spo0J family partition protein [Hyphomicrobiales bacterium]